MNPRFLSVLLGLFAWACCFAQHKPEFSLELGSGIPPLHYALNTRSFDEELAKHGQTASEIHYYTSTISGIARTRDNLEVVLSASFFWSGAAVYQHETFGVDPDGKPRYSLDDSHSIGRRVIGFSWSATAGLRYLWNPQNPVKTYSGLSFGVAPELWPDFPIVPGITFIGLRYGGSHFYVFAENTISPVAFFVYGGVGWKLP